MEIAQIARFRAAKKCPVILDTKTWTTYLAFTICIEIKIFGIFNVDLIMYDIHYVYILLLTLE